MRTPNSDFEARIRGCTRGRATDEQSAQDQQRQRQCELRGDERVAQGDPSGDRAGDLAGVILERRPQVRPRQSQRRAESKGHRRERAETHRRKEHRSIGCEIEREEDREYRGHRRHEHYACKFRARSHHP
jgi:hypothetical protein